jgi:hypothetical protein
VTNSAISADNPDPVIVCDTREQEPLVFTRLRSVRGTLTTGDYGILGAGHAAAIERKIIDDLVACCGPERALLRERQREGIALAKRRGVYRGRKKSLSASEIAEVRRRGDAGESKAQIARDHGISRQTLYQYLRKAD